MRLTKLAAGLSLAGVCTLAHADPVSVGALLANAAFAATAATLSVGQFVAAFVAVTALNSAASRRAQQQAAAKARAAANASLQDRQITVRSAVMPRPVIYGRALVGGAIVFAHTSGARSEFLHLVVAIAGHRCDAVEEIWFNDQLLPTPDVNGDIQSGAFAKSQQVSEVQSSTATSFALAQTPAAGTLILTRSRGSGENEITNPLALGTDYSLSGATVTILTGHAAGDVYTANYSWNQGLSRVRVRTYLGTQTTADADLMAASGGRWTSAHVGQGITYAYIRLEYDQDIFAQVGVPEIRFVVRGKLCRDPRDGVTRWTPNAAICTGDYLLDTVHGLGAAAGEVPDAELSAAANISDEEVTLYTTGTVTVTNGQAAVTGSGTAWLQRVRRGMFFRGPDGVLREILSIASDTSLTLAFPYTGGSTSGAAYSIRQRRYTVNGVLGTEVSPRDNLQTLVGAMAGSAVWVQGRWLVRAGAARALEPAITVDSLADGDINVLPRAPRAALFNTVTGTFLDRSQRYAEGQWPEFTSSLYRTQDNNIRIARELSLPLTDDATAAQRLGKIMLERSRQALTITLRTNLSAYDLVPTDWVPVTVARYGWTNKVFEVLSRRATPGGSIEYTLRETASAVYDWAQGEQTLVDLAPNSALPNPFAPPPAISGLTVASGTAHLLRQADGSIITRGFVQWTASTDIFVRSGGRIEIEYKRDDETTWTAAPPETGDAVSAYIGPLEDRRITLVRARQVNSLSRVGSWTTISHVVVGKTALPSTVAGLTLTQIPGAVRINVTPTAELDVTTLRLKRGASWAAGTRLDGTAGYTDVDGNTFDWAWPAFGTYTVWAAWVDSSGNEGPPVSALITVTAGGIGIGGPQFVGLIGNENWLRNGSFTALTSGNVADHWAQYNTGSTGTLTVSRQNSGGVDNGPYQNIQASALAAGTGNRAGFVSTICPIPLTSGGACTVSAWTFVSTTRTIALFAECLDASNAILSTPSAAFARGPAWTQNSFTFTAPAGTVGIRVYVWVQDGTGASVSFGVDQVMAQVGDIGSQWTTREVGTNEIYPGSATVVAAVSAAATTFSQAGSGNSSATALNATYTNDTGNQVRVRCFASVLSMDVPTGTGGAPTASMLATAIPDVTAVSINSSFIAIRSADLSNPYQYKADFENTFLLNPGVTCEVRLNIGLSSTGTSNSVNYGPSFASIEVIKR